MASTESPVGLPAGSVSDYLEHTGIFTTSSVMRIYAHTLGDDPMTASVNRPGSLVPGGFPLDSDCTGDTRRVLASSTSTRRRSTPPRTTR